MSKASSSSSTASAATATTTTIASNSLAQNQTTSPPIAVKFSIEETKANLRAKVNQNLNNLVELTRSTVRTSETNELFRQCFKQFVAHEAAIDASVDKLKKVEIISTQLNYQLEAIRGDCEQLKDVSHQISSIQQLHKRKSAE